uniref:Uncharacterized protein n=1 Tax=Acrobeloides nanus TaxID=290746 RepID=A0A914CJ61_9BILA
MNAKEPSYKPHLGVFIYKMASISAIGGVIMGFDTIIVLAEEIQEVYGASAITHQDCGKWLKRFRDDEKDVDDLEDEPRSGRPSKTENAINVNKIVWVSMYVV